MYTNFPTRFDSSPFATRDCGRLPGLGIHHGERPPWLQVEVHGYVGAILGLCWGYVGVMLGLYWGYIGVISGLCWGYIRAAAYQAP